MKRGLMRVISAMIVVILMAYVRTDADPELWQIAMIAIMFYETGILCLKTVEQVRRELRRERRRAQQEAYVLATKEDMRRIEQQVFNHLRTMEQVS